MAAAPANVANLQADTLSARQDAVRLSENDKGGVWIQYFGGKQKHTTAGNAIESSVPGSTIPQLWEF